MGIGAVYLEMMPIMVMVQWYLYKYKYKKREDKFSILNASGHGFRKISNLCQRVDGSDLNRIATDMYLLASYFLPQCIFSISNVFEFLLFETGQFSSRLTI